LPAEKLKLIQRQIGEQGGNTKTDEDGKRRAKITLANNKKLKKQSATEQQQSRLADVRS